jgi:hypothetical protein
MDITQYLKHGKLSSPAGQYQICRDCRVVDLSMSRIVKGAPCPACGSPSKGGLSFFNMSDLLLLDLIQEAYLAIPRDDQNTLPYPSDAQRTYIASVMIFFCTLKELLLVRFIYSLMDAKKIPDLVQSRLLDDNHTHSQRLIKLFPSLVGVRWDESIAALKPDDPHAYSALNAFLKTTTDKRNDFVHKGLWFDLTLPLAEECLTFLFPLLELFVSFNNAIVHPIHLRAIHDKQHHM